MNDPKKFLEAEALTRLAGPNPTVKDVAEGVKVLIGMMWSKEELSNYIEAIHGQLCAKCPKAQRVVGKRGYVGYGLLVAYVLAQLIAKAIGFPLPEITHFIGG